MRFLLEPPRRWSNAEESVKRQEVATSQAAIAPQKPTAPKPIISGISPSPVSKRETRPKYDDRAAVAKINESFRDQPKMTDAQTGLRLKGPKIPLDRLVALQGIGTPKRL